MIIDYKGNANTNPLKRDISSFTPAQLRRLFPRRICRAGYVIESVDAMNTLMQSLQRPAYWRPMPHLDCPGVEDIAYPYFKHLEDKGKEWIIETALTGENHLFFKFLICTQGQFLEEGYLGMPEEDMPVFVEGEFEGKLRAFLKENGLEKGRDYVWKTQLD